MGEPAATAVTLTTAQPAQSLAESALYLKQQPLSFADPLYADLRAARATMALNKLEIFLRSAAAFPNAFAKAAFVGNRGSGKSTYLLHLEHELREQRLFTPIHIYLDESLETDCDYSDLLLWIVSEIADKFTEWRHPVDEAELSKVTLWFAETTLEQSTDWKKEIGFEATAEAKGSFLVLPGVFSLKLLARLKSMIRGSEQSRKQIRQRLQNYATELRNRVNTFLDHARDVLKAAGKPDRLLIVQDNLDRLRGDAPRQLFDAGGHMLTEVRADILYVAPLALTLAPFDLRTVFAHLFTMPNVKVRLPDGRPHAAGIDGLFELVRKRLQIDLLFENHAVVRFLIEHSGGSVRDLIRLLDDAQLEAQAAEKTAVDDLSARAAVKNLRVGLDRVLKPGSVYYPILAEVHRTKREFNVAAEGEATREKVTAAREFFAELIGNGTVLEYNGEESWYDVHPALCDLPQFKDASGLTKKAKGKRRPQ